MELDAPTRCQLNATCNRRALASKAVNQISISTVSYNICHREKSHLRLASIVICVIVWLDLVP